MKKVNGYDIQEKVNGFIFLDYVKGGDSNIEGSEYKLYVKFIDTKGIVNKCGLVIIDSSSHYVVNNDYRFHHLEIKDFDEYYDEYIFISFDLKTNKPIKTSYFKFKDNE